MSDVPKKAEEEKKEQIFICGDGWLAVFDLLAPSQLGLGIALISRRFDFLVDEHFKTRKWTLGFVKIKWKIVENGTRQMDIVNFNGKSLPIPQNALPKKVVGFRGILINYIDQNVIHFLRRFLSLFAARGINLDICAAEKRTSAEHILWTIWPLLMDKIHGMFLHEFDFSSLRSFAPSILCDCPSLRFFFGDFFPHFPPDDSANASEGQAVAKWLLSPRQDGAPKVFQCGSVCPQEWFSNIEGIKTAFLDASSPVSFIVANWVSLSFVESVVPFCVINELTGERLALRKINNNQTFLLIRCPISRDEDKWAKWEKEANEWKVINQWITIAIEANE